MMMSDIKATNGPNSMLTETSEVASSVTFREVSIPNGTLIKRVGTAPSPIWLVISGVRYGYTSREKFLRVHIPGARVFPIAGADDIPEGPPWGDDLELISAPNYPVFLLSNGRKRGFSSEFIFNSYQCNWNAIHNYSVGVINPIPEDAPFPSP